MSRLFRTTGLFAAFAAGLMLAVATGLSAADKKSDAKKSDPKAADAKSADKDLDAKADKKATDEDQFVVPDGKPAELLEFIEKVEKARPTDAKSQEDLINFIKKSRRAMVEAANKITAADVDAKTRSKAFEAKLQALVLLERVGDADAGKQVDKLWGDVIAELKASPTKNLAGMAAMLASRQEHQNPEAAVKSLKELSEVLAKSKDADLAELAKKFEGTIRRLSLMGHQMEIKGTLLDGKPFDQGTLKGKVVLVDFWATWCGPCRAELPNVKKNYEKYHDKGFEVVGVSLDQSAEPLKKFIEDEKITWPILFPQDEKDQFWNNPLAVYYGVNGIPCVILTNQKGDVVSLNARGPELGKKLEELLGKVEEKEAKVDEKKPDDAPKTPKK